MPSSTKVNPPKDEFLTEGPSEVSPGVFIGTWKDARLFKGARFCVLDESAGDRPPATHIPIYNEEAGKASVANLDRLASAVGEARDKGEPVLIFCGQGVRRSPLAAAWYLRRFEGLSLDGAYERIRAVRPIIEHAREWVGNADELDKA